MAETDTDGIDLCLFLQKIKDLPNQITFIPDLIQEIQNLKE